MCTEALNSCLDSSRDYLIENKESIKKWTIAASSGAITCAVVAAFTGISVGSATAFGAAFVPMGYVLYKGSSFIAEAVIPKLVLSIFPQCKSEEIRALTEVAALLLTYFTAVIATSFILSHLGSDFTTIQSFSLAASVLKIASVAFLLYKLKLILVDVAKRRSEEVPATQIQPQAVRPTYQVDDEEEL